MKIFMNIYINISDRHRNLWYWFKSIIFLSETSENITSNHNACMNIVIILLKKMYIVIIKKKGIQLL